MAPSASSQPLGSNPQTGVAPATSTVPPGAGGSGAATAVAQEPPSVPSAPSGVLTPAAVPGAPTGVNGVAGDAEVTLSWTAPANDGGDPVTGYTVTPYVGAAAQGTTTFTSALTTETI